VRRLILGGSGLIFKGRGFYITDYKRRLAFAQNDSIMRGGSTEHKEPAPKPIKEPKKVAN